MHMVDQVYLPCQLLYILLIPDHSPHIQIQQKAVCQILIIVTMMLMTVTTIPTNSKIIPNTNSAYLSLYFPYVSPPSTRRMVAFLSLLSTSCMSNAVISTCG